MKLIAVMAMMAVLGTAKDKEKGEQVVVYLANDAQINTTTMIWAQNLAKRMFASIGVEIVWHAGNPPTREHEAIWMNVTTNTPADLLPGSMAFARPVEGIHIRIFWDRIRPLTTAPIEMLAHVMVHEITHILEGFSRHSAEGVLKARWENEDIASMQYKPLPFMPEDVNLIRQGLKIRSARLAIATAASVK